jgi:ABC-2 type transport system permease protein
MKLRLLSLIRKEFIQIVRDPRTLALTLIYPLFMLFALGSAFTDNVSSISVAVLDQDQSSQSRALLTSYRVSDYFNLDHFVANEYEINQLIESNKVPAAIIIPPDYGKELVAGRVAQVGFIIDGSNPNTASTALSAATTIGQLQATRILAERTMRSRPTQLPIDVRPQIWFNPDMITTHFMIPALIGMILQFLLTFLTAISIVRERERGTMEQLIVTPIRSWELIAGKLIPYALIAFFATVEILVIGVLVFRVPINGSLALLLVLSALFLLAILGLGLLISTMANTQGEAMLTAMFFLLPAIFLSGFMFPLDTMPFVLQLVSYAIPLRYFLVITRGIMLKGSNAQALMPEIVALSITAFIIIVAAVRRFRKQLD